VLQLNRCCQFLIRLLFRRFPPEGADVPIFVLSSTSSVLVLFRTDASVREAGFDANLSLSSSGDFGPFSNQSVIPAAQTVVFDEQGKTTQPLPYSFDVSGDEPSIHVDPRCF
jgi:hypothetical protein